MSRFHGPQHRGVTRERRDRLRIAADVRNALSTPQRHEQNRAAARAKAGAR